MRYLQTIFVISADNFGHICKQFCSYLQTTFQTVKKCLQKQHLTRIVYFSIPCVCTTNLCSKNSSVLQMTKSSEKKYSEIVLLRRRRRRIVADRKRKEAIQTKSQFSSGFDKRRRRITNRAEIYTKNIQRKYRKKTVNFVFEYGTFFFCKLLRIFYSFPVIYFPV